MQEIGLSDVYQAIDAAFKTNDYRRVEMLLFPALDQFDDTPQLHFYAGNFFFNTGKLSSAQAHFERCVELDSNPLVLANLGATYRRKNHHDKGIRVLEAALDRDANYEPALVNLGSMYVNEGCPEKGIPYLERAVDIGRKKGRIEKGAEWNLGLLYLEDGRFKEGFDIYRRGYGSERLSRTYSKDPATEPKLLEPGDPVHGKTIIVYGEQGIGDELMAATCIKDAREEFGEVIFECHPRLEGLYRAAFDGLRIYPTRKEDYIEWPVTDGVKADYKCPIMDLASRYRHDVASFKAAWDRYGPTYSADADECASYREHLKTIAQGRPIVGLATRGGVMQTARMYRTMRAPDIDILMQQTDALFVSLDYDDMFSLVEYIHEKYGEDRFRWFPSIVQHWDYQHAAALIGACDLTVTVCQSAAHLSAHMGRPTRVLTPKRCAWRYAPVDESDSWYWAPDPAVKLYRQVDPESWTEPLQRVVADIKELA